MQTEEPRHGDALCLWLGSTAMAHVVRDDLDALKIGSRVEAVWAADDERRGSIRDITCFRVIG